MTLPPNIPHSIVALEQAVFRFERALRLNGHRVSVTDPVPANVCGFGELQDTIWMNPDGTRAIHYPSGTID